MAKFQDILDHLDWAGPDIYRCSPNIWGVGAGRPTRQDNEDERDEDVGQYPKSMVRGGIARRFRPGMCSCGRACQRWRRRRLPRFYTQSKGA